MTKKRASGLKIDHQKLSSLSNREEKKKWEAKTGQGLRHIRDSIRSSYLYYQIPRKLRKKECGTKKIFEDILQKNSKFGKRHKLTDSRSSVNSKQDKLKEILTQTHQNKTAENQRKRKHLESSQEKNDT